MGKSKPLEPQAVEKEDITSIVTKEKDTSNNQKESFYTQESAVTNKKTTLIDKLQGSLSCILQQNLSQKLEEDLTGNARSLEPYWNELSQEISEQLLSAIKIDSCASDLTTYNGSVNNTGVKSWFSMKQYSLQNKNSLTISSQLSTVLAADYTGLENTRICSKKIRVYPEEKLRQLWKQWIAAARRCYNLAIAEQRKSSKKINVFELEKLVVNDPNLPDWIKEVPRAIKVNAVKDAHAAYQVSKNAKFRSCRDQQQTIKFKNENYRKGTWYPKLTKGLTFKASEPVPKECSYGTQLTKVKDRWYASFPELRLVEDKQQQGILWIDPGVRCFITGFDTNRFIEFGDKDFGRITRLCQHLDKLQSRLTKANSKQRRRMRMAAFRMRQRIRNLIMEAHKQIAHYLTNNYRLIFLPSFESSNMVRRTARKIKSKTARAMLTWAHYRFKQVLKHQASLRGCVVVETSEAYTSKTCAKCGQIHEKLGGSKVFKCPKCGHVIKRDWNGALNIMLRVLSDTTSFFERAIVSILENTVQYCSA